MGGLRYQIGREMPLGMQVLYGAKLADNIRVVDDPVASGSDSACGPSGTPVPTDESEMEEYPGYRYCGATPEREDLPSCPFCGSDNLLVDRDSEGWYLECNGCLAEGPRAKTQAEAERKWCGRC